MPPSAYKQPHDVLALVRARLAGQSTRIADKSAFYSLTIIWHRAARPDVGTLIWPRFGRLDWLFGTEQPALILIDLRHFAEHLDGSVWRRELLEQFSVIFQPLTGPSAAFQANLDNSSSACACKKEGMAASS